MNKDGLLLTLALLSCVGGYALYKQLCTSNCGGCGVCAVCVSRRAEEARVVKRIFCNNTLDSVGITKKLRTGFNSTKVKKEGGSVKGIDSSLFLTQRKKRVKTQRKVEIKSLTDRDKEDFAHEVAEVSDAIKDAFLMSKKKQYLAKGVAIASKEELERKIEGELRSAQLTLQNTTQAYHEVSLWYANRQTPVCALLSSSIEEIEVLKEHTIVEGISPQAVVYNPVNDSIYVVNQLSNSLSILASDGRLLQSLPLIPNDFPGQCSPVAVAIHLEEGSPLHGTAYVIGSVANSLLGVSLDYEVRVLASVGNRPIDILFNPIDAKVYVCNLVDDSLSVIDTKDFSEVKVSCPAEPRQLCLDSDRGIVYVLHQKEQLVSAWNTDLTTEALIGLPSPLGMAYHKENKKLWILCHEKLMVWDMANEMFGDVFPLTGGYVQIVYHPLSGVCGLRNEEGVLFLDGDKRTLTFLTLEESDFLASHPLKTQWFSLSALARKFQLIGYGVPYSPVVVNDGYEEIREDFQHNPALIDRVCFSFSDRVLPASLGVSVVGASGKRRDRRLSFRQSQRPDQFEGAQRMAMIRNIKGAVLDGKHGWNFRIAPLQRITISLHYRQFHLHSLLPENAVKATNLGMSKGVFGIPLEAFE